MTDIDNLWRASAAAIDGIERSKGMPELADALDLAKTRAIVLEVSPWPERDFFEESDLHSIAASCEGIGPTPAAADEVGIRERLAEINHRVSIDNAFLDCHAIFPFALGRPGLSVKSMFPEQLV